MKRLLFKLILLASANAAVGLAILQLADARHSFEQWQTDSVLLATPRDTAFDMVILGASRVKLLTRIRSNLDCLQRELRMKVLGMASAFGGGIVPAQMYLSNFYERGNTAGIVLISLPPSILFSRGPNQDHKIVYYEPFRFDFLLKMVRHGFGYRRIITYVRSKFTPAWLLQRPVPLANAWRTLTPEDVTPRRIQMRIDSMYTDGLDEARFKEYAKVFEDILGMARGHGARVVVIFAPTLLGEEPGTPKVRSLLAELGKRHAFEFYDFTNVLTDPSLYADLDHLNSKGAEQFVTRCLKPVLIK